MTKGMTVIECKYGCGFKGEAALYIGFFQLERITKAHEADPYLPKYGSHLGVDCPQCGKFQSWQKQTDETMLGERFYVSKPELRKNGMASYTATSANILTVNVKTNCPMGGDSGHGGMTVLELIDEGGTDISFERIISSYGGQDGLRIMLGGDCECDTFIECLEFAIQKLKEQQRENLKNR